MHEWHETQEMFSYPYLVLTKSFVSYTAYVSFWGLGDGAFATIEYEGKEAGNAKSKGVFLCIPNTVIVTLLNYGFKVDKGFIPDGIEEQPRYVVKGAK